MTNFDREEGWINSSQAAKHLGLSNVKVLYRHIRLGIVPREFVHRYAGRLRFKRSELDQLVNAGESKDQQS